MIATRYFRRAPAARVGGVMVVVLALAALPVWCGGTTRSGGR